MTDITCRSHGSYRSGQVDSANGARLLAEAISQTEDAMQYRTTLNANELGGARVSRVGSGVSPKHSLSCVAHGKRVRDGETRALRRICLRVSRMAITVSLAGDALLFAPTPTPPPPPST